MWNICWNPEEAMCVGQTAHFASPSNTLASYQTHLVMPSLASQGPHGDVSSHIGDGEHDIGELKPFGQTSSQLGDQEVLLGQCQVHVGGQA